MITAQKGVVLDRQSVARDTQAYSKELYSWGQKEKEDIKDGECSRRSTLDDDMADIARSCGCSD